MDLPADWLLQIFSYLDPWSLISASLVDKKFRDLAPRCFKELTAHHFPQVYTQHLQKPDTDWYALFRETYIKEYKKLAPKMRSLFSLVKQGDLDSIKAKKLNKDSAGEIFVDTKDANGKTLLDWALSKNYEHIIDYFYALIKSTYQKKNGEIEPAAHDKHGRTILYMAVLLQRSPEEITSLIDSGVEVNQSKNIGTTPLLVATSFRNAKQVEALLNANADVDFASVNGVNPCFVALEEGYADIANLLMPKCHNIGARIKNSGLLNKDDTLLHAACKGGLLTWAAYLINKGANVNASNYYHATPIFYAAQYGHTEILNLLISHHARLEAITEKPQDGSATKGDTPLHAAATRGHTECVQALLAYGATVDALNDDRETPLHRAAMHGHTQIAQLLVQHHADINLKDRLNRTPLFNASGMGHLEVVRFLLTKQADLTPGMNQDKDNYFYKGDTALHMALRGSHVDVAELLIDNNAGVDLKNHYKTTPLFVAVSKGHLSMVQKLIAKSANPNAVNCFGVTPIHLAVLNRQWDCFQFLVTKDLNLTIVITCDFNNAPIKKGDTLLHAAVRNNQCEYLRVLLAMGMDPHIPNAYGSKPIHEAATFNQGEMFPLLMARGVSPNDRCATSATPLHIAAYKGNLEAVKALLDANADVNLQLTDDIKSKVKKGDTALHIAMRLKHEKIARLLIKHKASIDIKNREGKKPLDVAPSDVKLKFNLLTFHRTVKHKIATQQKDGFSFFNLFRKYSDEELMDGVKALKKVYFDGASKEILLPYDDQLKSSSFSSLYKTFKK